MTMPPPQPMSHAPRVGWWRHAVAAGGQALQWRLLLLWLLATAVPLAMLMLPLWRTLAGMLDHAPAARALIEGFDPAALSEAVSGLRLRGYGPLAGLGALVALALLMPWMSGVAMAAAASPQPLRLAALAAGGMTHYGRMARLWLWALLPLGLAAGAGAAAVNAVREHARTMVLEADAEHLGQAALALGALLLVLAHASVDAARAQLVIEPHRRSVVRAWGRAVLHLVRRPGRILLYVVITAAGLLLAAALGLARVQVAPVDGPRLAAGLLLGLALVAVLAWMRCARLFALVRAGRPSA
jgi:hypothetical protein